jgi:hypothetical protein
MTSARESISGAQANTGARGGNCRAGGYAPRAVLAGGKHLISSLLERPHWIHSGGVSRRNQGGNDAGENADTHGE